MRRYTQNWEHGQLLMTANNVRRRYEWFFSGASMGQLANAARAAGSYATGRTVVGSMPVLVKIDISPVCNLHCTYCVHARPTGESARSLSEQRFSSQQRVSVEQFGRVVDEIAGRSAAVALYYIGDPLTHPHVDELCGLARQAGLNSHVSTNFSFHLSPERLESLVTSGLTHLTVCIDSMSQEKYGRTRIGGNIGLVRKNLEQLLAIRDRLGLRYPRVEAQYIKYQHNLDELEAAARWCAARGVDQFTDYWGHLHNYADLSPELTLVHGPRSRAVLPRCAWPWFAMQLRYDGAALPCCYHRVSEQYRVGGDDRPVGDVFVDGVGAVWNSPAYRAIRRLAGNPTSIRHDTSLTETFCHKCPAVFHTDSARREISGREARWEDVYLQDQKGNVSRR